MNEPRILRHVVVRGRVQSVGFRAFVEHHAMQRSLSGWVRNRRDGSVEAVFGGPAASVEGMVKVCGHGPLSAKVDAVDVREASDSELALRGSFADFAVLPTG